EPIVVGGTTEGAAHDLPPPLGPAASAAQTETPLEAARLGKRGPRAADRARRPHPVRGDASLPRATTCVEDGHRRERARGGEQRGVGTGLGREFVERSEEHTSELQ